MIFAAAAGATPVWVYILGGLGTFFSLIAGSYVAVRNLPNVRRKTEGEAVEINVKIAGNLRDDAVEDRRQAREDFAGLRKEFDDFKRDTDAQMKELLEKLTAEMSEKERLARENIALIKRVGQLEGEVEQLKTTAQDRKDQS